MGWFVFVNLFYCFCIAAMQQWSYLSMLPICVTFLSPLPQFIQPNKHMSCHNAIVALEFALTLSKWLYASLIQVPYVSPSLHWSASSTENRKENAMHFINPSGNSFKLHHLIYFRIILFYVWCHTLWWAHLTNDT